MNIEIKRWDNSEIIICGEYESVKDCLERNKDKSFYRADLRSADLSSADLRSANLRSANLSYANLRSADLRSATLRSAALSYANLRSADLSSADLRSAKGINKYLTTPLYSMLDQVGIIRAYKLVNGKNEGVYNGGLKYIVGETVEELNAETNEFKDCGAGINLATLDWCIREWQKGYKILIAEFTKDDIACIPVGSDGKFRVFRCNIFGEKNLKDIGLE